MLARDEGLTEEEVPARADCASPQISTAREQPSSSATSALQRRAIAGARW